MYFVIISFVIGALTGYLAHKAAGMMISARTTGNAQPNVLTNDRMIAVWICFFALLFANVAVLNMNNSLQGVKYMIWFSVFLLIAAVDYVTRKIPNELLLILLISKITFELLLGKWNVMADLLGFGAAIILYATKTGNLKTKVPVGPFLSLGAVITGVFPIIQNI